MRKSLRSIMSRVADLWPLQAAQFLRLVYGGPTLTKEGNLWRLADNTGTIFVPFIRRYGMYLPNIKHRISQMTQRYALGDLSGALIIDIGAHLGEFAVATAPFAKKILSFEPDPCAREALVRNVREFTNVEVLPIALSDQSKISKFFIATELADSSLFEPEDYDRVVDVEARRLDSLNIDVRGFTKVFLKMDAEGFEPEVLRGAGEWLRCVDAAAIDVSPERGGQSTYVEVKEILEAQGLIEVTLSDARVLLARRRR